MTVTLWHIGCSACGKSGATVLCESKPTYICDDCWFAAQRAAEEHSDGGDSKEPLYSLFLFARVCKYFDPNSLQREHNEYRWLDILQFVSGKSKKCYRVRLKTTETS